MLRFNRGVGNDHEIQSTVSPTEMPERRVYPFVAQGISDTFPCAGRVSQTHARHSILAPPVELADGGKDLYIQQDKFHDQFAADVSNADATLMAATQRPVTVAALNEASSEPAWKTVPSYFVYGDKDKNIPAQAQVFMAERAHAKKTVVVKGASHVVMVSNPKVVASLIETAATAK